MMKGKKWMAALLAAGALLIGGYAAAADDLMQNGGAAQGMSFFSQSGDALYRDIMTNYRGRDFGPSQKMREEVTVEDHTFKGFRWFKFISKGEKKPGVTKKILYIHGGAWVMPEGPQQLDFARWLADSSGAEVYFPEYPLAPEHDAEMSMAWVLDFYKEMLKDTPAHEISLMGDSAGGAMALSLAMMARDRGLPQPNSLILYSPGVDIRIWRTPEEMDYNARIAGSGLFAVVSKSQPDILRWWQGKLPETDDRVNPIFGSLKGLAPMTIFTGSTENVAIMKLAARAAEERVPISYYEKLNAVHTWVVFPNEDNLRERALVLDILANPTGKD